MTWKSTFRYLERITSFWNKTGDVWSVRTDGKLFFVLFSLIFWNIEMKFNNILFLKNLYLMVFLDLGDLLNYELKGSISIHIHE